MKETVGKDAMGVIIKNKTIGAFCVSPSWLYRAGMYPPEQ